MCACGPLTPRRHAVSLLQFSEVSQPRVLDGDGARLQGVLPHRVLALVPDLEGAVVALHRLVHVNVVQLRDRTHRVSWGSGKMSTKEKVVVESCTFIMFLKTYCCVSVLLSLLGLQIMQ